MGVKVTADGDSGKGGSFHSIGLGGIGVEAIVRGSSGAGIKSTVSWIKGKVGLCRQDGRCSNRATI